MYDVEKFKKIAKPMTDEELARRNKRRAERHQKVADNKEQLKQIINNKHLNNQIMTLNEYQQQAMTTCMSSCYNIPYMLFNLQGEVGELSSKIAKLIRKGDMWFADVEEYHNRIYLSADLDTMPKQLEIQDALKGELGDVLWQLSGLCSVLGFGLEEVAKCNLAKLASRKQRGVIDGDGDNR